MKTDLDILQAAVDELFVSGKTPDTLPSESAPVRLISEIILAKASKLHTGMRVLSHIIFADLFLLSKSNE